MTQATPCVMCLPQWPSGSPVGCIQRVRVSWAVQSPPTTRQEQCQAGSAEVRNSASPSSDPLGSGVAAW